MSPTIIRRNKVHEKLRKYYMEKMLVIINVINQIA